jgi:hypothetical protein
MMSTIAATCNGDVNTTAISVNGVAKSNISSPPPIVLYPGITQEIVSWYFTHIDETQPHTVNIQSVLVGPIVAMTAKVLNQPKPVKTSSSRVEEKIITDAADIAVLVPNTNTASTDIVGNGKKKWNEHILSDLQKKSIFDEIFHVSDTQQLYNTLSQRAQARMNAFMEGICLSIDGGDQQQSSFDNISMASIINSNQSNSTADFHTPIGINEGLAGFRQYDKSHSTDSSINGSNHNKTKVSGKKKILPQIGDTELLVRIDLYYRTIQRCYHLDRDCVVSVESNRAIKARAQFLVVAFVDTVGTVRQQGPILTRLLTSLTMEVLAVPILSETLVRAIRRIVSNYVHTTSFASLAFLSSPESAAETRLKPSILQYLKYLQQFWQDCELECDIERLLASAIDPVVRSTFKNSDFQSIGHLLEVCQGYRAELRNIQLPPYNIYDVTMNKVDDAKVRQAIRDLKREIITLNGYILPPVSSRADLIHLLSQMLNSRSMNLYDLATASFRRSNNNKKKKSSRKRQSTSTKRITGSSIDNDDDDIDQSGSETNVDSDVPYNSETTTYTDDNTGAATTANGTGNFMTAAQDASARKRSFRLSTVDLLTKRLLLAAGRTGTGGDAYFVVRDLFGGPDVEVVPTKNFQNNPFYQHRPHAILSTNSTGTATNNTTATAVGTIDLIVRLTSVTIKCHASFDVYPRTMVGECEPLIQVHTTTSETIHLQEVRVADLPESELRTTNVASFESNGGLNYAWNESLSQHNKHNKPQHYPSDSDDAKVQQQQQHVSSTDESSVVGASNATSTKTFYESTGSVMIVQERKTDKSGYRTLSIRPALYEMVESFNTPS